MAEYKLIGKNYTTPDLVAKVTGKAKYAEDYRAEGMLFCRLLLSPMPHARVRNIDAREALAMPGVKAILRADELPAPPPPPAAPPGQPAVAQPPNENALTNEPVYQGEPILAVAAVDETTAAEAIERIVLDLEPLPFAVDPLDSLRPRTEEGLATVRSAVRLRTSPVGRGLLQSSRWQLRNRRLEASASPSFSAGWPVANGTADGSTIGAIPMPPIIICCIICIIAIMGFWPCCIAKIPI